MGESSEESNNEIEYKSLTLRLKKFDTKLERKLITWIEEFLELPAFPENETLRNILKDGTVLCDIITKVDPTALKQKVHRNPIGAFKEMENISTYLASVSELFNLDQSQLFSTIDLTEGKGMNRVLQHLSFVTNEIDVICGKTSHSQRDLDQLLGSPTSPGKKKCLTCNVQLKRDSHDLYCTRCHRRQIIRSRGTQSEIRVVEFSGNKEDAGVESLESQKKENGSHEDIESDKEIIEPVGEPHSSSSDNDEDNSDQERQFIEYEKKLIERKETLTKLQKEKEQPPPEPEPVVWEDLKRTHELERSKELFQAEKESDQLDLGDLDDSPGRHTKFVVHMIQLLLQELKTPIKEIDHIISRILLTSEKPNHSKALILTSDQHVLLNLVQKETSFYIKNQTMLEKVIKVQSIARGWLIRHHLKKYNRAYLRQIHLRNKSFRDLLNSEIQYVADLETIMLEFEAPLRKIAIQQKTPPFSSKDLRIVFSNIHEIHQVHENNLKKIKNLNEDYPFIDKISSVFFELAPTLKCYGEYVRNFKLANDTLEILQKNEKFNSFMKETLKKLGEQRDLQSFLSLPINQISKYVYLLESLTNTTPNDLQDSKELPKAYAIMAKATSFVKRNLSKAQNAANIHKIQKLLINFDGTGPIGEDDPNRELIHQANLVEITNKKHRGDRRLFLFNDICLVTKVVPKGFKFKYQFPTEGAKIRDIPDQQGKLMFEMTSAKGNCYKFQAKTKEEKDKWFEKFKKALDFHDKERIIGISLDKLQKRQKHNNGIPQIVEKCIQSLKPDIQTEGLFRLSAPKKELERAREQIDKGMIKEMNFAEISIHTRAGLLKLWLRELPEPLFTFKLYDPIVKSMKEKFTESKAIEITRELIAQLPTYNFKILAYIFGFLFEVTSHEAINKMNATNLAIVFGPTLIRAKVETIETSLDIPYVNTLLQTLIEKHDAIFNHFKI